MPCSSRDKNIRGAFTKRATSARAVKPKGRAVLCAKAERAAERKSGAVKRKQRPEGVRAGGGGRTSGGSHQQLQSCFIKRQERPRRKQWLGDEESRPRSARAFATTRLPRGSSVEKIK
ncbi:hypothetical protein HPB50_020168 [Hyalomma asiaticum]|uniref:Uncharacterized protein n=1 Tax=Hyalomma asiaticum TaxID=266040 RepID=A0ACB7TMZ0_HYAAI|nr:hypothetical protein HPB50_020168 [Hyalomma asiaticum]